MKIKEILKRLKKRLTSDSRQEISKVEREARAEAIRRGYAVGTPRFRDFMVGWRNDYLKHGPIFSRFGKARKDRTRVWIG